MTGTMPMPVGGHDRRDLGEELHEELHRVLPIALAGAAPAATAALATATPGLDSAAPGESTVNLAAAALSGTAVEWVANGLRSWVDSIRDRSTSQWPSWLRPAFRTAARPEIVTLTQFSNDRLKYIRELPDAGAPLLLTRHGTVVAALIPLEPGSYEKAVYPSAMELAFAQGESLQQAGIASPDGLADAMHVTDMSTTQLQPTDAPTAANMPPQRDAAPAEAQAHTTA